VYVNIYRCLISIILTGLDAAGATVQIFMFSVLAVKVKQNAPMCHTFLEIVYRRYGATTHIIFVCFALATNILVYAAVFLIPTGVCAYVVLGGLRATFLCKWIVRGHHQASMILMMTRRLLAYYHCYDHHPVLHVQRLRYE
jgi:Na+/proline symporter